MVRRLGRVLAGFAVAVLAVGGFLWAVGPRAVAESLAGADLPIFAVGFVAVVVAFLCWSEAFRQLLGGLGADVGGLRFRSAYMSSEFPKQVIPMGQAAAPVFVSYAVSSQTDASADEALAAATITAFVNIAASMLLATGGLAYLVVTRRGPSGPLLATVLAGLVVSVLGLFGALALFHYRRDTVERAIVGITTGIRRSVGRVSARVREATDPVVVRARFETYYEAVDGVLANRRAVGWAGLFCLSGWLCFLAPVYTSFLALGTPIPFAIALFVVPMVMLLNVVPLPGGLGGFEVAVAGLLAALSGIGLPTAAAGVFLYRLSNYWFVVLLGGLASASLSVRLADQPAILPVENDLEPE